ncbi:hypothetical protein ES332_D09G026800v1 [Gossypium tomentosum]|uniref:CN hydrolase domain-containing protein n=2 Tax=Gossypium tomentosum TaxID=34277 RepID=A0A5D2JDE1_GOSTO|nr:hypothetical protein ES332_D09G026800v1 [Gossypium tomentosum]
MLLVLQESTYYAAGSIDDAICLLYMRKEVCEFAEPVNGESTQFLQEFALKYNMVIISSILERDINHGGTLWNTAVIIGNHGNIIDSLEYCSFLFKLGTSMEPIAFVDCNC